jgi:hypothetical protein
MEQSVDVFAFRDGFAGRGVNTHVCVTDEAQTTPLLSREEIDRLFFGYVLYKPMLGRSYIGVWGARNASRFRQLLRERGAELKIVRDRPPAPLSRWVTHGKERAEAARTQPST